MKVATIDRVIEIAGELYKAWLAERTGKLGGQQLNDDEMEEMRRRAEAAKEALLEIEFQRLKSDPT